MRKYENHLLETQSVDAKTITYKVNRGQEIYLVPKYFPIDYLIVAKKKPYLYKAEESVVTKQQGNQSWYY